MILRLFKRVFSADALGLILIVIALQTFTYGVSASLRGSEAGYLFGVCLLGALVAFGLSKGKFSGIEASAVLVTMGLIGVWILGARIAYPLLELFRSILALIPQLVPAIRERIPIDASLVIEAWMVIVQASVALAMRWQTWFAGTHTDVIVNDALIHNMIWTLVMWLVAAWTGWFTWRRKAIAALLPEIVLLAAIISYSAYGLTALWLMVFIQLLLMGLCN